MPTRPLYFLPITDDPKRRDKGIMDGWREARDGGGHGSTAKAPTCSFVRCVHEDEPEMCHDHLCLFNHHILVQFRPTVRIGAQLASGAPGRIQVIDFLRPSFIQCDATFGYGHGRHKFFLRSGGDDRRRQWWHDYIAPSQKHI